MTDKKSAVLGFGLTGKAMIRFLLEKEKRNNLYIYNDDPVADPDELHVFTARGVTALIGRDQFPCLEKMDQLILSPGFDGHQDRFKPIREKGIEIISEIEFASQRMRGRVIGVTGTNGKSTTVSLIHHLLVSAGRDAKLAGNIGRPLVENLDEITARTDVVLELSSFQLEEIIRFRPRIALLLNLTPDHLDRYPSMAEYAAAKLRIFANQLEEDAAIVNEDDPFLLKNNSRFGRARRFGFSLKKALPQGAFLADDEVRLRIGDREERISLSGNQLRGRHNLENILAAFLACRLAGVGADFLEKGLSSFRGLPHRMESVGRVGGVEFINDSKATNVDAVAKSVSGIDRDLVLILGGKDKGGDFSTLIDPLRQKTVKILLIGKAAGTIERQLHPLSAKLRRVKDLREAVIVGYQSLQSRGRGIVLLAPACASFDMFHNFEHRGDTFRDEVARFHREMPDG